MIKSNIRLIVYLLIITGIGAFLRLHNLSPFKYYPDAYQSLLTAYFIHTYGSVVGYLGNAGMVYPPYFMWTRPIYPLLINLTQNFIPSAITSAYVVSLISGIASIPLAYTFYYQISKSKRTALGCAFLLALSFEHTTHSGLIMTESLAVLLLIIFLWILVSHLKINTRLANVQDLLTGALFGIIILHRYEYSILVLPVLFLIRDQSHTFAAKAITITAACIATLSVVISLLYPIPEILAAIQTQFRDLFLLASVVLILGITFLMHSPLLRARRSLIWKMLGLSVLLLMAIDFVFPFLRVASPGMRNFFQNDFLLITVFAIGLLMVPFQPKLHALTNFSLLSIGLLAIIYYKVNPAMERYWVHMLPFLLIPASFAIKQFFLFPRSVVTNIFVIMLFAIQTIHSYNGFRYYGNRSLFEKSYEEQSALKLRSSIPGNDSILIAPLPEPYFLFTGMSTHTIADKPPYLYFDGSSNPILYIVQDMAMRTIFPNFSNFLNTRLQVYQFDTYRVFAPLHYRAETIDELLPATIYRISYEELFKEITSAQAK